MKAYKVEWTIEIYAESPLDAAQQALEIQRDEKSSAIFFDVYDDKGDRHAIDLLTDEGK